MSFAKILIANRGEIACRVIASARSLGYRTVAVYSEADADARHVTLADQAVCIGPAPAAQSYLNIDALLDACRRTGADAVHPGYGFLSENAGFAEACAEAGITFIGPPPAAIRLMGSKRLSKIAMQEAGVPCVPGYQGEAQDDDTLIREAQRIGLPLMIKASAGGGGRGMRVVTDAADISAQLKSARLEANSSFGNDELILERAVINPRHVEIQVFGDHHGNVIHLGERDCSVQRRHQKVVEEAPSPALDEALRARMGEAAVNAARACNYVGAGTVEFLLADDGNGDGDRDFYFLEMNTRLQVEHPVTELVTGQDLVAWQLRVAAGEPLPLTQDQVRLTGHAMEVRLYAEDPARDYLPQTGTVGRWRPASGDGVRVDHGLVDGAEVGSHYDPMLAKIIAVGASRDEARRRLLRAVEDTELMGLEDNRRLLAAILRHPEFAAGRAGTAFIGDAFADDPSLRPLDVPETLWALAALLLGRGRPERSSPPAGWHSSGLGPQPLVLAAGDQERTLPLTPDGLRDGPALTLESVTADGDLIATLDGVRRRYRWWRDGERLWLQDGTVRVCFEDRTHRLGDTAADGPGSGRIQAPMDGAVTEVTVATGDKVARGQVIAVLEAMKMEHSLMADCDGVVETVNVSAGDQVRRQQLLVTVAPDTSDPAVVPE